MFFFHYDLGRQGVEISMYQVLSFTHVFLCQLYAHTYAIVLAETVFFGGFSKKYSVYIILTMTMFVMSHSFISLPSFMFVNAAVSDIHDLNQKKKKEKNFENGYFQFTTFPRHITDPFFVRDTF